MTDELSIQKQQPSAIPYVALGAAGVGGASYLGLPRIESVNKFMTEPAKYNSYEDIIKEADDKFENSLKSAEGAEKDLMEKAKNYREKVAEAGKDYDDKLAKEIADNVNEGFVPDENYKNLEKDLQSKTEALENKRKTLVEEKAAELRKNNTGTLTPEQKKTVAQMELSIQKIENNLAQYRNTRSQAFESINNTIIPRIANNKKHSDEFEELHKFMERSEKDFVNARKEIINKKAEKNRTEFDFKEKNGKTVKRAAKDLKELKFIKTQLTNEYTQKLSDLFKKNGIKLEPQLHREVLDNLIQAVEQQRAMDLSKDSTMEQITNLADKYNKNINKLPKSADMKNFVESTIKRIPNPKNPNQMIIVDQESMVINNLLEKHDSVTNLINQRNIELTNAQKAGNKERVRQLTNTIQTLQDRLVGLNKDIEVKYYEKQKAALSDLATEIEKLEIQKKMIELTDLNMKAGSSMTVPTGRGQRMTVPQSLTPAEQIQKTELEAAINEARSKFTADEFKQIAEAADKTNINNLDNLIQQNKSNLTKVEADYKDLMQAKRTVDNAMTTIESVAGKGATVNAQGEIITANGKKWQATSSLKLSARISEPINDPKVTGFQKKIDGIRSKMPKAGTAMTEAEILEKAAASVTDDAVKLELEAKETAQKALDEAKSKLPKVEGKTEQAVKEAFVKANGSREEYIKKATDSLKDDIKGLCEGKRGGKFWGIIAGTAALGGAIGLLLRPKAKDV